MSRFGKGTLTDVAFTVSTALSLAGVQAVLSGGGAAAVYAPAACTSDDLDFILTFSRGNKGKAALESIGFEQSTSRGIFVSGETPLTVELLPGPVAIGDEIITEFNTMRRDDETLFVLTAADSIRDRLAAGIYWNDLQAARQAALVAKHAEFDLEKIRSWCEQENGLKTFELFYKFFSSS